MFEANAPQLVAERQQKVVMVEMAAAKRGHGLCNQRAIAGKVVRADGQAGGFVGHHVQRHAASQLLAAKVQPGQHRRIHQRFVIGLGPAGAGAIVPLAIQRAGHMPPGREAGTGRDPDLARVMAGGIQAHPVPLQVGDLVGHGNPPGNHRLAGAQRRGMHEIGHHRAGAIGQIEMEGENLDRVAPPADRFAIRQKVDVHQFLDGAGGAVMPGDPLRQLQHQRFRAWRQRYGLGNADGGAGGVCGVDVQGDRPARPRSVDGIGHAVGNGYGGRRGSGDNGGGGRRGG